MTSEREHRDEIVRVGRSLYERGFVVAMDGNISVRLDAERLLVTPTCMCKGRMSADDLVIVNNSGQKLHGRRDVSSEVAMHLLIYRMRPDINAVVHAHPPTATGFSVAGVALDQAILSEVVITVGSVPLARYGTPGTGELTDALRPLVQDHCAILMANHGVVAYGTDLESAFMRMETVEHFAKIALVARTLGTPQVLSRDDVHKLEQIRQRMQSVPANGKAARIEPVTEIAHAASDRIPVNE
ncbi:MAG TPA: class II aldolase/adducin family protein [Terriglobales bacterium]|nr:class II aldolase/adducin family protein [Terriglobales bacterium]